MESTGVYWLPIFARLEPRGFGPHRVNARHVKTGSGGQTDGNDAQWLQKLPTLGLVYASFRPAAEVGVLRTLLGQRAMVIEHRAPPMLHLQNTLTLMHMPWREGRSEIIGVTGPALLRALVAGEHDSVTLAPWRHPAGQASADQIAKALSGTWPDDLLCMFQQALARCDDDTQKLLEGDAQIERPCAAMQPRVEREEPPPL